MRDESSRSISDSAVLELDFFVELAQNLKMSEVSRYPSGYTRICRRVVRFVHHNKLEVANLESVLELVHPLLHPERSNRGYDPSNISIERKAGIQRRTRWHVCLLCVCCARDRV